MDFAGLLKTYLAARGFQVSVSSSLEEIGQVYFSDLPSLVLLETKQAPAGQGRFLGDPAISHVPVICYSTEEVTPEERLEALGRGAVDCLGKPLDPQEVFLRAKNLLLHTAAGNLHPFMAGIPGNCAAAFRLQRLLEAREQKWALMWIGLNHLCPFSEVYGYAAAREALEIVASALSEGIRVAGHKWDAAFWVGGEEFALFTAPERVTALAEAIFAAFERHIAGLFSAPDREAGYFTAVDRRDVPYQVPLLSLSVGVVSNEHRTFSDARQVRQVAEQVRCKAREIAGNSLYIDGRKA